MKGEIDRDFYCSAGLHKDGDCEVALNGCYTCKHDCNNYHRKWPTPEQFFQEYPQLCVFKDGAWHLPDSIPAWYWIGSNWNIGLYEVVKNRGEGRRCVIACTPWGKPPDNWRPE